ncbi:MAG: ABC transporter permease subunit [Candidatus Helarchaeota archaeon]|nr:ABC transporter permease subunit [Candidatus Helarchaeota archaeon]
MKKAIAVMKKDLKEISRNFQVFGVMIFIPIVFGVALPIIIAVIAAAIPPGDPEGKLALTFIVDLYGGFILMIAVIIPTVVASDSFAGEKERKTIEALLAAPISDSELFLGKVLVSFVPTIILTYLSATIFSVLVNLSLGTFLLPDLNFIYILLAAPLVALLAIELTVFVSVKVKGFREAQQLAGVIIIPIILIVVLNTINISVFIFPWNIIFFAVLIGADIGLYGLAIKKFGRENIISKI